MENYSFLVFQSFLEDLRKEITQLEKLGKENAKKLPILAPMKDHRKAKGNLTLECTPILIFPNLLVSHQT